MVELLRKRDGTLSVFIQEYCYSHDILVDVDVFNVAFGGSHIFDEKYAAELIEQFADLYELRNTYWIDRM